MKNEKKSEECVHHSDKKSFKIKKKKGIMCTSESDVPTSR